MNNRNKYSTIHLVDLDGMTVQEVIDDLSKYDPDSVLELDHSYYCPGLRHDTYTEDFLVIIPPSPPKP